MILLSGKKRAFPGRSSWSGKANLREKLFGLSVAGRLGGWKGGIVGFSALGSKEF
jgi:hypothetical protein